MVEAYSEELFEKPSKNSDGQFDFATVDAKLARYYQQGSKILPVRVITPVGQSAQEFKLTDGVDIALVNTDGSLNVNLASNVLLSACNTTVANNNTQTIYTVPAGKETKIYVYGLGVAGTSAGLALLTINGVVSMSLPGTSSSSLSSNLGNNYILLTAGQTVTVTSPGATVWATGFISYYEYTI